MTSLTGSRAAETRSEILFPRMRWVAAVWMLVWFPTYAVVWGWANFLHVCNIGIVLSCLGLWLGSPLLLSSQAVVLIPGSALWAVDVAWRALFGQHLFGGTEYMWDERYALGVRLLSLYHLVWPVLMVWAVRRSGYDARALPLQCLITAAALGLSRLADPAENVNFAYQDPLFHRIWGPAPLHLTVVLAGITALIYLPTHWALLRVLGTAALSERPRS
ncbi:MAG: hypothetical protein AB1898_03360 [Acidobacteriota bacterium]